MGAFLTLAPADAGPPVFQRGQLVRGLYVDLFFGRRRLRTQDPLSSDEGNSSAEDMSTLSSDAGVCGRRTPCLRTRATRLRTIAEIYVDLFFGGGRAGCRLRTSPSADGCRHPSSSERGQPSVHGPFLCLINFRRSSNPIASVRQISNY